MKKLITTKIITGKIILKTGLHIGAGNEVIEIGGIDNPVVKNPLTGYPYIPGSSLKGKIRCLLEIQAGKIGKNDGPCSCGQCEICGAFGSTSKDAGSITRVLFRDAFLSEESRNELRAKGILATEAKMENSINRLTGTALNPRTTERVIAGLAFDLEIGIRVFEGDDDKYIKLVEKGIALLQKDTLGGSGSRGYGKVQVESALVSG